MANDKISEQEFDRQEDQSNHAELVEALKAIAARDDNKTVIQLEKLLAKRLELMQEEVAKIARKDTSAELRPLITQFSQAVQELKEAMADRPTSFRIVRAKSGLIEKITAE